MSRLDHQEGLMPSMLDRLIDPDSGGTKARPGYTIEQMAAAVQRDLEELLNTRQTHPDLPEDFKETHESVLAYGLPDLTSLNALTPKAREGIGMVLEAIVARFEPRLKDIHAELQILNDKDRDRERTIKFRISARLNVDPAPEVAFDTVLELSTGHYSLNPTAK
jgi:type VI secretion system protein ImpF